MIFNWNDDKNSWLKQHRHVSFEQIVVAIEEGQLLAILDHPNTVKYENQSLLLVNYSDYVYVVPVIKNAAEFFMKTIFPSRKYTTEYLKGGTK